MKILKICTLLILLASVGASAQTTILPPPPGGTHFNFGQSIYILPNGNYVLVEPNYADGATSAVGAVFLYNGSTHSLISTLKGSISLDRIGNSGIKILQNGNFVVLSTYWHGNKGAVTWVSATLGLNDTVSSSNSLVGSTFNDYVGSNCDTLSNGNYVVYSDSWDNGTKINAGHITVCNGITGTTGVVSSSNSLVGNSTNDKVGMYQRVLKLSNGHLVAVTPSWDNGTISGVGAITWINAGGGTTGVVSASNSLVGASSGDAIGNLGGTPGGSSELVFPLNNGNYIVCSPSWNNGTISNAGAITWCSGSATTSAVVSIANSIVGTKTNDYVGIGGVVALKNGNAVASSLEYSNATHSFAGAATWINGLGGTTGAISTTNSLMGDYSHSRVGSRIIPLDSNNNYVVSSSQWSAGSGALNVGAVTWCNGATGRTGIVSGSNSLIGSTSGDVVGSNGVLPLTNGNYVVLSPNWDNGSAVDAGAATWCDGKTGRTGFVSNINSLVGSQNGDKVSLDGAAAINLTNGNYVINSPHWKNGSAVDAGASTWGSGVSGIAGPVSVANSLVGSNAGDYVGARCARLTNGNYVVGSDYWDSSSSITNSGALTWGSGTAGVTGTISSANSLVGSHKDEFVGARWWPLQNGNYVAITTAYRNGADTNLGAVTVCDGLVGTTGIVSSANSLVGSTSEDRVADVVFGELGSTRLFVVTPYWDNGAKENVGAITLMGTTPSTSIKGAITEANSLLGNNNGDFVGWEDIYMTDSKRLCVLSPNVDYKGKSDCGAITFLDSTSSLTGYINTCNSAIGTQDTSLPYSYYNYAFNSVHKYYLAGFFAKNEVQIFNPNSPSLAKDKDSSTQEFKDVIAQEFQNETCRYINTLKLASTPALPMFIQSKVWVDKMQDTHFVNRHYQLATTATGSHLSRVTLYFTQAEMDSYNALNANKLPTNPTDAAGIANVLVHYYAGKSNDTTGLPASYSSTPISINPVDADVIWNTDRNLWEISFDAPDFGGYFVYSDQPTSINSYHLQHSISVYPNPANDFVIVSGMKANARLELISLDGRKISSAEVNNPSQQLSLADLSSGVYLLRYTYDGHQETLKITKQ